MQRVALVLAAATAVSFGTLGANAAVTTPAPSHAAVTSSAKAVAPSAQSQVQKLLAQATDYALSPGHMDHFCSLLDHSTRHRLAADSTYKSNFGKSLDAQITQLNQMWKTKYGHAFSTSSAEHAYDASFATVETGKASDTSFATQFLGDAQIMPATNHAKGPLRSDETLAIVKVKSADGVGEIHAAMACKSGGTWKLFASPTLTANTLRSNLQTQFAAMTAAHAQWPASEADAYREVTHRVLMAIENQPTATAQKHASAYQPAANAARQQASAAPVRSTMQPAQATSTNHWWQFWRW